MTVDKLMKPDEVAALLGVQVSTVYQWTHMKRIPYIKVGRFVRFRESEINRWLEKHSIREKSRKQIVDEIFAQTRRKR